MNISLSIFICLKKAGKRQNELADDLGIHRQSVSQWLSGKVSPPLSRVKEMADYFGISVSKFIYLGEETTREDVDLERAIKAMTEAIIAKVSVAK